jgi:hypothetical protein
VVAATAQTWPRFPAVVRIGDRVVVRAERAAVHVTRRALHGVARIIRVVDPTILAAGPLVHRVTQAVATIAVRAVVIIAVQAAAIIAVQAAAIIAVRAAEAAVRTAFLPPAMFRTAEAATRAVRHTLTRRIAEAAVLDGILRFPAAAVAAVVTTDKAAWSLALAAAIASVRQFRRAKVRSSMAALPFPQMARLKPLHLTATILRATILQNPNPGSRAIVRLPELFCFT